MRASVCRILSAVPLLLTVTARGAPGDPTGVEATLHLNSAGGARVHIKSYGDFLPPGAGQLLSSSLPCPWRPALENRVSIQVDCPGLLQRNGLRAGGYLRLAAFYSALQSLGYPATRLIVHVPSIGLVSNAGDEWEEWGYRGDSYHQYLSYEGGSGPPGTIQLDYGYDAVAFRPMLSTLALALLGPLAITLWLRRRVGTDPSRANQAARYTFLLWFPWILNGAWLFWLIGAQAAGVRTFLNYVDDANSIRTVLWTTLGIAGPPLVSVFLCCRLGHSVWKSMPGMSRTTREIAWTFTAQNAAVLVPLALVLAGVDGVFLGEGRVAFGAWLAAYLARKGLVMFAHREIAGCAVLAGELHDRIREMARRARVRLQSIVIIPAGSMTPYNAFATRSGMVLLTEELVGAFTKREVLAIAAHELGHLGAFQPGANWTTLILCVLLGDSYHWLLYKTGLAASWLVYLPLGSIAALFLAFALSRYYEYKADAKSVAVCADPEAMITGLMKLAELAGLPAGVNGIEERLGTHPSMRKRVAAIARAGSLSGERLDEIVAAGAPDAGDHFQLPEWPRRARIFSAPWQARMIRNRARLLHATFVLSGLAIVSLVSRLTDSQPVALVGMLAGLPLAFLLCLAIEGGWRHKDLARLCRELRRETGAEDGFVVGLAPGSTARLFLLDDNWDLGVFELGPGAMRYTGERAQWAIPRDGIQEVTAIPGLPAWWPTRRLAVRLTDGTCFTLGVPCRWNWRQAGAADALLTRIEAWRAEPAGEAPPESAAPELPAVEGAWITRSRIARSLARDSVMYVLVGLALTGLLFVHFGFWIGPVAAVLDLLTELPWTWSRQPAPVRAPLPEPAQA